MLKNVIFDFGNVLGHFEPDYLTGVYIKDEADRALVSRILFDRKYWDRLDDGTITDEEVLLAVCPQLPERLRDNARCVMDHWFENVPPVAGMGEVVQDLKAQGIGVYLVSNISPRFALGYGQVEWLKALFSQFDGLVFSGLLGITKPNPAIFQHLLKEYGLSASECLFVDDNADNVASAQKLGIHGYCFDGDAAKLREFLKNS